MVSSWVMSASACIYFLCMSTAAHAETWEKHIELGQAARKTQHLSEAEKNFKAAVQDVKHATGKELQLAESLDGLAGVYRDQNKSAKSEACYKQSLNLKERVLGPWHISLAETLDNVAGVLSSQGKNDKAKPLYQRAHQIREQAIFEHPDVYVDGVPKPVTPPK